MIYMKNNCILVNHLFMGQGTTPKPSGFVYTEDSEEGDTITLPSATLPCHTPTHERLPEPGT